METRFVKAQPGEARPGGYLGDMPTVTVKHFAVLRERRGVAQETLEVSPGTTLEQLYLHLFPPGPEGPIPVAWTRNQAWARAEDELQQGDVVAFLPPLGGG